MATLREQASAIIAARRSELRGARAAAAAVTLGSIATAVWGVFGFGDADARAAAAKAEEMVLAHLDRWEAEGLRRADAGESSAAWWRQWQVAGIELVAAYAEVVGYRYEATPLGVVVSATVATATDVRDGAVAARDAAWSAAAWWGRWGVWVVALGVAVVVAWTFRAPLLAALSSASEALGPVAAKGARKVARVARKARA